MGEKKHQNPQWLREKYHNEGLTGKEMAELADCSRTTIYKYMSEFEIPRDRGQGYRVSEPELYRNEAWLREQYHDEKQSTSEIAEKCGCHKQTIKLWLEKHGISKRTLSEAAEIRVEKYPSTKFPEDMDRVNWWHNASEEEREEFRQWLSEKRQGINNPMSGVTGQDHHNWKEDKPDKSIYQTQKWQKTRREALRQANHKCGACGQTEQLVGHHIIPLSAGGEPFDVDNVSVLCRSCHMEWEGLYLQPDNRHVE